MENNVKNALIDFIDVSESDEVKNENKNVKKLIIDEREGLIERVDKIFVDKSGRQLLREQY